MKKLILSVCTLISSFVYCQSNDWIFLHKSEKDNSIYYIRTISNSNNTFKKFWLKAETGDQLDSKFSNLTLLHTITIKCGYEYYITDDIAIFDKTGKLKDSFAPKERSRRLYPDTAVWIAYEYLCKEN